MISQEEKAAMAESARRKAEARAPKTPAPCPPHTWFRQSGAVDPEGKVTLRCHGACAGTRRIDLATWNAATDEGVVDPSAKAAAVAHVERALGLTPAGKGK